MRAGVARFVEIDDTATDVAFDVALQRGSAAGDWGEVTGTDKKFVIVF